MASHTKVFNVSRNCRIKRSQAQNRIDQGLSAWVKGKEGFEIRDLTLKETIVFRAEQSRLNDSLSGAELPGIKFVPPASAKDYQSAHPHILRETAQWCEEAQANL